LAWVAHPEVGGIQDAADFGPAERISGDGDAALCYLRIFINRMGRPRSNKNHSAVLVRDDEVTAARRF
jgi:hypothetical protein